jgi:hypothetical protein
MDTDNQILLSVGSAVLVSLLCFRLWGLEGAVFGFICTLLLIGFFKIWNMVLFVGFVTEKNSITGYH